MKKLLTAGLYAAVAACLVGCQTTIPSKLEVRDVSSGRTYTTYEPWGHITKGIGYEFSDAETGKHITLTNYELKTLESSKKVDPKSVEAHQYEAAKARGGVK